MSEPELFIREFYVYEATCHNCGYKLQIKRYNKNRIYIHERRCIGCGTQAAEVYTPQT